MRVSLAPVFPLDARVRAVTVDGREARFEIERRGDVQRAMVTVPAVAGAARVVFRYDEGTEVYAPIEPPARGAASEGLRICAAGPRAARSALPSKASAGVPMPSASGPPEPSVTPRVKVAPTPGRAGLSVAFEGPAGQYVRRTIDLPLR